MLRQPGGRLNSPSSGEEGRELHGHEEEETRRKSFLSGWTATRSPIVRHFAPVAGCACLMFCLVGVAWWTSFGGAESDSRRLRGGAQSMPAVVAVDSDGLSRGDSLAQLGMDEMIDGAAGDDQNVVQKMPMEEGLHIIAARAAPPGFGDSEGRMDIGKEQQLLLDEGADSADRNGDHHGDDDDDHNVNGDDENRLQEKQQEMAAPVNGGERPRGPPRGGPVAARAEHHDYSAYEGAHEGRLHGIIGVDADGNPGWLPDHKEVGLRGGFNLSQSEKVGLDRAAPDSRDKACIDKFGAANGPSYIPLETLPAASVVIVFYDEPFTTLMRSVHSVLNRTPPQLLKEVILVDDFSEADHIREGGSGQLEKYLKLLPSKVKLMRSSERRGIVGARMLGIEAVSSDIFVILDSHVEVEPHWIEPLVARVAGDRRRIVMPYIDGINPSTFEARKGGVGCTLGIIWKLMEHSMHPSDVSPASRRDKGPADYVTSPTMAGGLFAASREFFYEIGAYDKGMSFWGVENIEFSFRIWQCGGFLECSECSRVYHAFRGGGKAYSVGAQSLTINKLRTMAVWMGPYADLAWRVIGKPQVSLVGDISERIELRDQLQCKSFQWFLDEVWPESDIRNLPSDLPYLGKLKNLGSGACLDSSSQRPTDGRLRMADCGHAHELMYFRRSTRMTLVLNDEACVDGDTMQIDWCRSSLSPAQKWQFDQDGSLETRGKCLTAESDGELRLSACSAELLTQKWHWEEYESHEKWSFAPAGF